MWTVSGQKQIAWGGHVGTHQPENDPHDLDQPSAARMYDYYLGGGHNFAVDREAVARIQDVYPNIPLIAQANRAFLHRAVKYLLDSGIRQFLDLGSGIPTAGNVHEIVDAAAPGTPVVYVDIDPVAVAYSETILGGRTDLAVLQADIRRPAEVLEAAATRRLLDFGQPVGVLAVAVLHFLAPADDPTGVLAAYRDAVVSGSYLALSHGTNEKQPENAARSEDVYRNTRDPLTLRSRAEIAGLLTGWDLVDPGLVWLPEWRPDWPGDTAEDPSWTEILCGVGRRP
jgi:hypothetical protein